MEIHTIVTKEETKNKTEKDEKTEIRREKQRQR
jgi:hypothetical protein